MKRNLLICISLFLCVGCTNQRNNKIEIMSDEQQIVWEYPVTINLQHALENLREDIYLSYFVEEITYIPLELEEDYLTYLAPIMYDEEEEVFLTGGIYSFYCFDKSGKKRNRVGQRGDGPKNYLQIASTSFDTKEKYVYISSAYNNNVLKYDYQGNFIQKQFTHSNDEKITANLFLNDGNFIGTSELYASQWENLSDKLYGIALLDTLGNYLEIIDGTFKKIKNRGQYKLVQFLIGPNYFKYQDNYLLFSTSGAPDTVYWVVNNHFVPRYIFDYGNNKPEFQKLWIMNNSERTKVMNNSLLLFSTVFETDHYFMAKFTNKGTDQIVCFDKKTGDLFSIIASYYGDTQEDPYRRARLGFKNDIDGGLDLYPVGISSNNNYWISYLNPHQIKEWLTDDYFASRSLGDLKKQRELRLLVDSLDEEDNPILVLMKLKK